MDRGYYDEEKIQQLENEYKISLAIPHKKRTDKPLSKKKQKIYNKRARIEAKISEGKRVTGMNKSNYGAIKITMPGIAGSSGMGSPRPVLWIADEQR